MPIINFVVEDDEVKEPLVRPKVSWWKIIINYLISLIISGSLSIGVYLLTNSNGSIFKQD